MIRHDSGPGRRLRGLSAVVRGVVLAAVVAVAATGWYVTRPVAPALHLRRLQADRREW
ncbi:hypothetical protein [Streptomyces sp. NPDC001970]